MQTEGRGYTLIYYTGERPIVLEKELPANVFIFLGRPDLAKSKLRYLLCVSVGLSFKQVSIPFPYYSILAISGIIYSISSGKGLPEELTENVSVLSNAPCMGSARLKLWITKALSIYSTDQLFSEAVGHTDSEEVNDLANYEGVEYVVIHLIGGSNDIEPHETESLEQLIRHTFKKIDPNSSGYIDVLQFEALLDHLKEVDEEAPPNTAASKQLNLTFGLSAVAGGIETGAMYYLNCKGSKFSAKNWSMLYCGGAEAILSQLKDYKHKFGK
jgi:hypothetical protein